MQDSTKASELIDWGKSVLEGWHNINNNHPVVQFVKSHRYKTCLPCTNNFFNVCKACGCPLRAKLGSYNAACPKQYWDKVVVRSTSISDVMTKFEVFEKGQLIFEIELNN